MEFLLYDRVIDLGSNPSKIAIQRWAGKMSPEPETVAWIESLSVGATFFDIGASVGTHAIRAAVLGLRVTAFEPHEASWQELVVTVTRNQLLITCSNYALSNTFAEGRLAPGRSKYSFYTTYVPGYQHVEAITLDWWCEQHGYPDYVKLDVDGNEPQIIEGGEVTFGQVKSALIEVDPVVNPHIPQMMKRLGFTFDQAQVDSCMIRDGKYKGTANYIFNRR